jgi:hypothetical protein
MLRGAVFPPEVVFQIRSPGDPLLLGACAEAKGQPTK